MGPLTSEEVDFKTKDYQECRGSFIMIKVLIYAEDITSLNSGRNPGRTEESNEHIHKCSWRSQSSVIMEQANQPTKPGSVREAAPCTTRSSEFNKHHSLAGTALL